MMNTDILQILAKVGVVYVPFLFALCFHEYAHGWMARRLGDRTAELMGRLTMNPMAHIDPIGTVALPLISIVTGVNIFFGWAKPVPVNSRNLRNPRVDMFWVALAGPLSNLFLALIAAFLWVGLGANSDNGTVLALEEMLKGFMFINLALAIFNMIPVHPLDGGKVLARFLPESLNNKIEEHQQMASMLLLFFFLFGGFSFLRFPILISAQALVFLAEGVFHLFT